MVATVDWTEMTGRAEGGFKEQYDRMQRWFSKFQKVDAGMPHDQGSDNYEDEVRAFFENCYHLKDWIKNDPSSVGAGSDVESFIDKTPCMSLCADIANGQKHLERRSASGRSGENPSQGGRNLKLELGGEEPRLAVKYGIQTNSGLKDAFELATECVAAWDAFLGKHRLL